MRWAWLALLMAALAGCLPAFRDEAVQRLEAPAGWTHAYKTDAAGVFVAASSARIEAVEGPNCQLRNTLAGGPNSAVSCDAPGTYLLRTNGAISAGVVRR